MHGKIGYQRDIKRLMHEIAKMELQWVPGDIKDAKTMRHLPRKAEGLQQKWPQREALCAAVE